ncbi:helix-turn-helix transcriptional regulator [Rhizobium leguminosarum]|nr:helix-turn-helix transcriptional regulator [Rhizobium leguminosarum]
MNPRPIKPQGFHPVDVHVGKRILLARHARRMTQQDLARQLGMTFQQVQKYEKGKNRVSASVLYQIMQTLDAPASYFFDGSQGRGRSGGGRFRDNEGCRNRAISAHRPRECELVA